MTGWWSVWLWFWRRLNGLAEHRPVMCAEEESHDSAFGSRD